MNNEQIQEIREKQERITNAILENGPDKFLKTLTRTEYITCLLSVVERLQEENKAMKEALEWYANDKNYKLGHQTVLGERARTALSHLKGE